MEPWLVVVLVVGLLAALAIGWRLATVALTGAVILFAFASEMGIIGQAAYVACWFFFFPVMLVVCLILGMFVMNADR